MSGQLPTICRWYYLTAIFPPPLFFFFCYMKLSVCETLSVENKMSSVCHLRAASSLAGLAQSPVPLYHFGGDMPSIIEVLP